MDVTRHGVPVAIGSQEYVVVSVAHLGIVVVMVQLKMVEAVPYQVLTILPVVLCHMPGEVCHSKYQILGIRAAAIMGSRAHMQQSRARSRLLLELCDAFTAAFMAGRAEKRVPPQSSRSVGRPTRRCSAICPQDRALHEARFGP